MTACLMGMLDPSFCQLSSCNIPHPGLMLSVFCCVSCAAVCLFYASYTSFYQSQNTNLATPLGQRVSMGQLQRIHCVARTVRANVAL
jgi:hypothetical protein